MLLVQPQVATIATPDWPLQLTSGQVLRHGELAYEMVGQLNSDASNAILIGHALTGDAHVAGRYQPNDKKPGWWDGLVGPGKAFDTDQYCVICSNVLGGCKGSSGPTTINPETGKPYGLSFPVVTTADIVNAQARLIDSLGIKRLHAVAGGSLGGFQALQWAIAYPERVASFIAIASAARVSPQAIAFNAVGRHAIVHDPYWNNGTYYDHEQKPDKGLATARMLAHITYLSESALEAKFGRRLQQEGSALGYAFQNEFAVESYLTYQGESFIKRFDANSYLYVTKAMDYFDLAADYGSLAQAFAPIQAKSLIVAYSSDWLFPPQESRRVARALRQSGKQVSFVELESSAGHDAFLIELEALAAIITPFLANKAFSANASSPSQATTPPLPTAQGVL